MKQLIKKSWIITAILIGVCSGCTKNEDNWQTLFNGKDLSGFKQLNGKAPFKVVDGCLVGTTVKGEPNSFLATEQVYGDFILEFECLADTSLNSGVQFRSSSVPDYQNGRVHGYQCEIDPSNRAWTGGIYDEAGRGWLVTLNENPQAQAAYKNMDWNRFRIEAVGNSLRIWLNGENTANLYDDKASSGFIAFQVHAVSDDKPWQEGKQVKWRNIRILTAGLEKYLHQGSLISAVNKIPNTLCQEEVQTGWKLLFDGHSTNGWRGAYQDAFPDHGWKVEDGVLTVLKSGGEESTNGGDIVSLKKFSAFELKLEFKITEGANSGIKYFVTESEKQQGSAYGLEYQLLDDSRHPDAEKFTSFPGSRTLSSLYDLMPAQNKRFNGIGEWNEARIIVYPDNHAEHWLNGFKVLEYERTSEDFRKLIKGSKYAVSQYNTVVPFGEAHEGMILLQDHGDEVSFRSIKIRELR